MIAMSVSRRDYRSSKGQGTNLDIKFPNADRTRRLLQSYAIKDRALGIGSLKTAQFLQKYGNDFEFTRKVDSISKLTTELLHTLHRLGPEKGSHFSLWDLQPTALPESHEVPKARSEFDWNDPNHTLDLTHLDQDFFLDIQLPFVCRTTSWQIRFPNRGSLIFKRASFYGALLIDANLDNTVFQHTEVMSANLRGSSLIGMESDNADWSNSVFLGCKLKNAKFRNSFLYETTFTKCSMDATEFHETELHASMFQLSRVRDAQFIESEIASGSGLDCIFDGSYFYETNFEGVNFKNSTFVDATLDRCEGDASRFENCFLVGTRFMGNTNLRRSRFTDSILSGASFVGVDLSGVNFSEASLERTSLSLLIESETGEIHMILENESDYKFGRGDFIHQSSFRWYRNSFVDVDPISQVFDIKVGETRFSEVSYGEITRFRLKDRCDGIKLSQALRSSGSETLTSPEKERLAWLGKVRSGAGIKRLDWTKDPLPSRASTNHPSFVQETDTTTFPAGLRSPPLLRGVIENTPILER